MPFAYLIHSQRDTVLSLLKSIDNIAGPSSDGLAVFVRAWVDNAEMFVGFWATRVRYASITGPTSRFSNAKLIQ